MTSPADLIGLRYARANLLFGPGSESSALYRLDGVNFPLRSTGEKWAVQGQLEHLAHAVQADFSLWRVYRATGADEYQRASHGSPEFAQLLRQHRDALDGLDGRQPEVYLAVALRTRAGRKLGGAMLHAADHARARLTALVTTKTTAPIAGSELAALAEAETRLFERLTGVVGLRRAHTQELEWLLRRAPLRGIAEPKVEDGWQPDALVITTPDGDVDCDGVLYEPLGWDLWRLPACPLLEDPEQPPSLAIETETGTGFQALLVMGALGEQPVFPGPAAELLHAPLDGLGVPVDAVVHARWLGNREALGQVRKRIVDVEQVYRDQLESSQGAGWQADDDRTLAREYEQVLQTGARPPMLYATLSLAVGAPTREELERRVEAVRGRYGDVQLYRPRGLQEALFYEHLPRADGGRVREYVQQVTAQQFGAMVPTATTLIGDPGGLYLGYTTTGARRPVFYDATAPSRESRASAVMLAGTLGSGKTLAAQLIAHSALLRGSLVVDFDPKPDHGWTNLPELAGRVGVLELTGAADQQGRLDPMAIGLSEMREELTVSYLLELLRDPPASWEHAIARAVRDTARDGGRSTRMVIDRLRTLDGDAGREAADALEVIADVGLARLGFATTHPDQAAPVQLQLTTIRTPGLTLPEPGVSRETYTRAERISVATLSLVAALALRLVSGDRSRHKVVLLDEAWFLLASAQGRAVINRLVRLARAYNATVLLVTQRLDDVEGTRDLVGTWLVFGQDADTEATHALDLLGIEATPARVASLRAARAGRCVMRDLQGRVAEVQVHCPDPALLDAFNTSPTTTTDTDGGER
ncbi:ATP-binding protein [Paraconexibacter antarcticus]|uniref:ATP-binding protein n=1 Tax=Paraconexibacter antarcticus TaxID=2949664 RepID=A0ABY5DSM9_9ACTN|nr:ATP-binding protein [Paraconexibacter antarcticus]UTI63929.1 ATP-binding protein [Paraconexibacter antarcticus]